MSDEPRRVEDWRIRDRLDHLEAEIGALQVVEALRLATEALAYVADETTTALAARTTAKGALFGIEKALAAENFNRVAERIGAVR